MLNFIPTPCVIINELFCEPTKHNCLQDMIHMSMLHICPMATQRSCQHCYKINTWTSKEIFNHNVISFDIRTNIINSSNPCGATSTMRTIMHWKNKTPTSQLLVCCGVILKMKGCLIFLPPWVVSQPLALNSFTRLWQLITSTWELLELEDWKPNKLWVLFLCRWSKENPASSKDVTSFWVKLVPSWMGHIIGTTSLAIINFCNVLAIQ